MNYNIIERLAQLRISTRDEAANVKQLLIIDAMLNRFAATTYTNY